MSSDEDRAAAAARLPRNYRTILDVVLALGPGAHAGAHDIYVRARERAPGIGFATVHRGLARLHELGYVLKLAVPGETSAVYEPAAAPHAHFRCTRCGALRDVDFALPPAEVRALGDRHGIEITAESITFAGRCAACAAV